jgi:TPR repeat protein
MRQDWSGLTVRLAGATGRSVGDALVGEQLGSGGEGTIYQDAQRANMVLKLLHEPAADVERKIRAMLDRAPALQSDPGKDGTEIVQIAWPQEIVTDTRNRFCGFTMRRLNKSATVQLNAYHDPRSRARNHLPQSDLVRIYLAANLASVTEYINRAGHAVVDFKPQNVLAYRQQGFVCLIDCDGFLIRSGTDVFPAAAATNIFLAPEYHSGFDPKRLDEKQDRFALAFMIYLLLDNGWHPSSGTSSTLPSDLAGRLAQRAVFLDPSSGLMPPRNTHSPYFADETLALFTRAFVGPPVDRPTSVEWKSHLARLTKQAVQCAKNTRHWHYGKGCPWCELAARRPPAPVRPQSRLQQPVPPQWVPVPQPSHPQHTTPTIITQPVTGPRSGAAPGSAAPSAGTRVVPTKPPQGGSRRIVTVALSGAALMVLVFLLSLIGNEDATPAPAPTPAPVPAPPPPAVTVDVNALRREAIVNYTGASGRIDNDRALVLFHQADEAGDPLARMWIARSLNQGFLGLSQERAKATAMAEQAIGRVRQVADTGDGESLFLLASATDQGLGTLQDAGQALALYERACSSGFALACYNRGARYATGGTAGDWAAGAALFRNACEQGVAMACDGLGAMYQSGRGVDVNASMAASLYRSACNRAFWSSCHWLARLYDAGDGVAQDRAQVLALERAACDAGIAAGCTGLGVVFEQGLATAKDLATAVELYRRACEGSEPAGCYNLARLYASGEGVERDAARSAALNQSACDDRFALACASLSTQYQNGWGVPANDAQALHYLQLACDAGLAESCDSIRRRRDADARQKDDADRQAALAEQYRRAEEARQAGARAAELEAQRRQQQERQLLETLAAAGARTSIPNTPVNVPSTVVVPAGTEFDVALGSRLNSGTAAVEDRFQATTVENLSLSGRIVVPAGSVMRGVVTSVARATRTNRTARMSLTFDQITVGGRSYPIRGSLTRALQGQGLKGETGRIATGSAVGAVIGGILGGAKGAATGAAIGGGGIVAATEGRELDLPQGSTLRVRLDTPLPLP